MADTILHGTENEAYAIVTYLIHSIYMVIHDFTLTYISTINVMRFWREL